MGNRGACQFNWPGSNGLVEKTPTADTVTSIMHIHISFYSWLFSIYNLEIMALHNITHVGEMENLIFTSPQYIDPLDQL